MTEREICSSYRGARRKAQQIRILAELNGTDDLEIIKILAHGREALPKSALDKMYERLDRLEGQIREKEREYKAIAAALKGQPPT